MFDTYKEKPAKRPRCLFSSKHIPTKTLINVDHSLFTNGYSLPLLRFESTCRYNLGENILYSTNDMLSK